MAGKKRSSAAAALLERGPDLERLLAVLDRTRQGSGGVALFIGTAVIGKTSLLSEATAR